jgi:uncharacterized protein YceK
MIFVSAQQKITKQSMPQNSNYQYIIQKYAIKIQASQQTKHQVEPPYQILNFVFSDLLCSTLLPFECVQHQVST